MKQKLIDDMEYSLSDADIRQLLGNNTKIIKYSQLQDVNSIEQLLPSKFDFVVILVELEENVGHWECVVRNNNDIFFFDSYGARVDKQLLYTEKQLRRGLDQKYPLLSFLLNKAIDDGLKVYFNKFQYQQKNGNINTCGRWVCMFINYMRRAPEEKKNLDDFHNYILNSAKNYEFKDLDMFVTRMTN